MIGLVRKLTSTSLFRAVAVYGATNVLNKAIPFLIMPVFTRYLSPEDYGIIAMFAVVTNIVQVFNGYGLLNAISLKYFDRDRLDFPRYVANCLYLALAATLVLAAASPLLAPLMERLTDIPASWAWTIVLMSTSGFISNTLLNIWQAETKAFAYGLFQVLQTIVPIALGLWFVVGLGMDWRGRIDSMLIATTFFAVAALVILWRTRRVQWKYDREYARSALIIGAPLIPHLLGGFVMDTTDRILITKMVSVADTGIYAVGAQVGMMVLFVTSSFNTAWVPWLFERLKKGDEADKRRIVLITYAYSLGLIVIAFALSLMAPWFFHVFVGKQFEQGFQYVLWVALGYAFNGMYMMVTNYIFFVERTYLVSWVTSVSAGVNVLASYLLIRHNGAVGAAQGTMISHFCMFTLTWAVSARVYRMPWNLRRPKVI